MKKSKKKGKKKAKNKKKKKKEAVAALKEVKVLRSIMLSRRDSPLIMVIHY